VVRTLVIMLWGPGPRAIYRQNPPTVPVLRWQQLGVVGSSFRYASGGCARLLLAAPQGAVNWGPGPRATLRQHTPADMWQQLGVVSSLRHGK